MVLSSPHRPRLLTGQLDNFLSGIGIVNHVMSLSNKQLLSFTEWHCSNPYNESVQTAQTIYLYCSSLQVAILLTGGRQSPDGGSLEDAVQLMRNRDVTTYVISIGDRSDVPVQRPEDLFYLPSYSDLPRQVQSIAKNMTKPRGNQASKSWRFYIIY